MPVGARTRRSGGITVRTIDDQGLAFARGKEQVVDVSFDGRRVWSFWLERDGEPFENGFLVRWPPPLRRYLHGVTELSLTDPISGQAWFRDTVRLGEPEHDTDRICVVNVAGRPLSLDKSMKLVETFDGRDADQVTPLLDAIAEVLGALQQVGIDAFLAYGTALGAIRDGKLIGHDSDADLGYVSRYDHPADVIRESFEVQRRLTEMGYRVTRYSGGAVRIHVAEDDGLDRGLDVFGGFLRNGILYLMGEIETPYQRDWIFPLGSASLEGREFPVPRDTDRFLVATYGPHWRKPDPAFKFTTPPTTIRRFNGWFRGMREGRAGWYAHFRKAHRRPLEPSFLAKYVAAHQPELATVIDIGCGRGADVVHFADRGVRAVGLDYQPFGYAPVAADREQDPLVDFQLCNLLELRHVLGTAAWAARLPAPRAVLCTHVIEKLGARGRANLLLAARMILAGTDGRLYVQFLSHRGRDGYPRRVEVREAFEPTVFAEQVRAAGGRIVEQSEQDVTEKPQRSRICRMTISWDTATIGGVSE